MTIKSILLIEDDRFIGDMYSRSLSREGYQVDLIQNGEEGLAAALKGTYDMILLDVMLPEKKGNRNPETPARRRRQSTKLAHCCSDKLRTRRRIKNRHAIKGRWVSY